MRLPRLGWPVLWICLPVLSAAGALLLSNGYGNHVSIMAAAATIVALTGALVFARSLSIRALAGLLYCAALALMWAFTLRGQSYMGTTSRRSCTSLRRSRRRCGTRHIRRRRPGDAERLRPSPTLSVLCGIAPLVSELIYPALFALYPVALFALALRYLRPPFAFVAGVFLIAQNWFFQLIPGIARQEIGLLFFAGLALALLEGRDEALATCAAVAPLAGTPLRTQWVSSSAWGSEWCSATTDHVLRGWHFASRRRGSDDRNAAAPTPALVRDGHRRDHYCARRRRSMVCGRDRFHVEPDGVLEHSGEAGAQSPAQNIVQPGPRIPLPVGYVALTGDGDAVPGPGGRRVCGAASQLASLGSGPAAAVRSAYRAGHSADGTVDQSD